MMPNRFLWIDPIFTAAVVLLLSSPLHSEPVPEKGAAMIPIASSTSPFELVVKDLNFPEGPAWDGKDTLYVSNCYGGWIARIAPRGADVFLRSSTDPFTFEKTNGMTVARDGKLYACDFEKGAILRIAPQGTSEVAASGYASERFARPNDLAFDPQGNLFFTDPKSYRAENPDGRVYRLSRETGEVRIAADHLAFPNGLAFSADGKLLFVCESALHRITRFQVQLDGTLAHPALFTDLPGGDPDGINFDRKGFLYVAHFGGGAIYRIAPDGSIDRRIPAPGRKPSNVEFGGPDLRTLYITECETNAVYRMEVAEPGLPLFYSPGQK